VLERVGRAERSVGLKRRVRKEQTPGGDDKTGFVEILDSMRTRRGRLRKKLKHDVEVRKPMKWKGTVGKKKGSEIPFKGADV